MISVSQMTVAQFLFSLDLFLKYEKHVVEEYR